MSLTEIKSRIPDYARDLRLNLESVLAETGAPGLTQKQIGLVALASASASRHPPLVAAIEAAPAHDEVFVAWQCAQQLRSAYHQKDLAEPGSCQISAPRPAGVRR